MNEMEEEVKRPLEEQPSQSASEESPTKDGDE
jgi:hypothetical protein